MKEYGELLDGDLIREQAARSRAWSRTCTSSCWSCPSNRRPAAWTSTSRYQDSCHLAHAQRLARAPRDVLAQIPGLRLVEMEHADRCCGSAGVYSFTQPEMSLALLDAKMRDVRRNGRHRDRDGQSGLHGPAGRPGFAGSGTRGRVVHVMELLDKAYRAESLA